MSYNVLRQFVGAGGGGSGGVGAVDIPGVGGVMQNRKSPDFRSPGVGRYVLAYLHRFRKKEQKRTAFSTSPLI